MSSVESFVPSVLTITERAVEKVRDLKTEENNENIKLRVYVTGGGCSGFQYELSKQETLSQSTSRIIHSRLAYEGAGEIE